MSIALVCFSRHYFLFITRELFLSVCCVTAFFLSLFAVSLFVTSLLSLLFTHCSSFYLLRPLLSVSVSVSLVTAMDQSTLYVTASHSVWYPLFSTNVCYVTTLFFFDFRCLSFCLLRQCFMSLSLRLRLSLLRFGTSLLTVRPFGICCLLFCLLRHCSLFGIRCLYFCFYFISFLFGTSTWNHCFKVTIARLRLFKHADFTHYTYANQHLLLLLLHDFRHGFESQAGQMKFILWG